MAMYTDSCPEAFIARLTALLLGRSATSVPTKVPPT